MQFFPFGKLAILVVILAQISEGKPATTKTNPNNTPTTANASPAFKVFCDKKPASIKKVVTCNQGQPQCVDGKITCTENGTPSKQPTCTGELTCQSVDFIVACDATGTALAPQPGFSCMKNNQETGLPTCEQKRTTDTGFTGSIKCAKGTLNIKFGKKNPCNTKEIPCKKLPATTQDTIL